MKIHVIIDFMHIYYKYLFQLKDNRIKKLNSVIDWKGTFIEKDVTLIYYPLKDIEGIRKNLESLGHEVTISVCFDTKSKRKEEKVDGDSYKSKRKNVLTDRDIEDINFIEKILSDVGHNTYKIEGYEADDIANYLVKNYKDKFDYSIIYTNDKDLLINIDSNVGVMRYKQYKGYTQVDTKNYENYLENEFGVFIPYNSLGLFLSSVGDKSDDIKGISKFGKVAFKKLITKVSAKNNIDWSQCGDYNKLSEVVDMCKEFLTDTQYEELKNSFGLVSNIEITETVEEPSKISTKELREKVYMTYKMISLIP